MNNRLTDRSRLWWWILVGVLVISSSFVFYSFVGTLLFGLFVYYAGRPFARYIERYVGSTAISGAIAILFIVLPFVVVFAGLILAAVAQLASLRAETFGELLGLLFPNVNVSELPRDPVVFVASFVAQLEARQIGQIIDGVTSVAGLYLIVSFHFSIALLFSFFLLRDDRRLSDWLNREFAAEDGALYSYLAAVDRDLHTVYFGAIITIFSVIVLSFVIYLGLNLIAPPGLVIPSPILLAVITGLATLIPLVGRSIVYLLVAAGLAVIAITTNPSTLWFPVTFLIVMILGLDTLVNYGVHPYFAGQTIHTGLMLFAFIFGTALFGWYGIFYGPFLLAVNVEFARLVLPRFVRGESLSPVDETAGSGESRPIAESETDNQPDDTDQSN